MTKTSAEKLPLMNYYYFLGKRLIPNGLVKYMLKNKWHKKNPRLLTKLGEFVERLENLKYSFKSLFKMLIRSEFKYVYNRLFNKSDVGSL